MVPQIVSSRRKHQKTQHLDDLCAETYHFLRTMKVWYLDFRAICHKDYDDWRCVHFNTDALTLDDVMSENTTILGHALTVSSATSATPREPTMPTSSKPNTTSSTWKNTIVTEMKNKKRRLPDESLRIIIDGIELVS